MTQKIFVGDVQGCAPELAALVARADAEFGRDYELWLVGDLINRGPDNRAVLHCVRALHREGRARIVLGNHEIGLVLKWLGLREIKRRDTIQDLLGASDVREWIDWLLTLPLVETGEVAGEAFAMVHAAVHPDWDRATLVARARRASGRFAGVTPARLRDFLSDERLDDPDRQVLDRITRCRSVVDERGEWSDGPPGEIAGAEPWYDAWRRREHGYAVVYGHWAKQRLRIEPRLRGLDSGCVHHSPESPGWLTGWLPDDDAGFIHPDTRFWSFHPEGAASVPRDTEK